MIMHEIAIILTAIGLQIALAAVLVTLPSHILRKADPAYPAAFHRTFLPLINEAEAQRIVLWEANSTAELAQFKGPNFENFCPDFGISANDGHKVLTQVAGVPAIELVANVNTRPGVVINVMSHRDVFSDASMTKDWLKNEVYHRAWRFWGKFKRGARTSLQNNTVNIQLVDDNTEYMALIQWILNPMDGHYGWVMLRTDSGDIPIHFIGDDDKWHSWSVDTSYGPVRTDRVITRIEIDNRAYSSGWQMPTGPTKPWRFSFAILLEATNQWTSCSTQYAFAGSQCFTDLGVSYIP